MRYNNLSIPIAITLYFLVSISSLAAQTQTEKAQQFWEKGNALIDNSPEEAVSILSASIDLKESKHADHDMALIFYNTGNIASAVQWCNRGLKCDFLFETGHTTEEVNGFIHDILDEIDKQFAPLKIRLRGIRMNSLARIDSVDYRFDLQALNQRQRLVLRKIEEGRSLQMTGIGEDGSVFCEVPYFPVLQESVTGRISSYTLEISPDHRYRFDFNLSNYKNFVLDIDWQKEFLAVESIPPNYVKIITPDKYSFLPAIVRSDSTEIMQGIITKGEIQPGGTEVSKVYYIPLPGGKDGQIIMNMNDSEEKSSERAMDIIAKISFIAVGIGLISFVR